MASSFTTNKVLEKPGNGDYVDTWNVPVNTDMDIIDQAFGGVTSLNATGGSATLTDAQYRSLIVTISGAMSASVTYTIPSGKGGQWIVRNTTTDGTGGPWTVTFASGGGGTSVTVARNVNTTIFSDGTNIYTIATIAGSSGQVIYNSGGVFAGSANMTFDGTTLTTNALTVSGATSLNSGLNVTGAIVASGNVTAFSDETLKKDVVTIDDALSLVNQMRGVKFTMINSDEKGVGVIAQEVQKLVPEAVQNNNGILSVAYGNLVGVLIEAVKELSAKVEAMENKK
jgi:hypothetical protein